MLIRLAYLGVTNALALLRLLPSSQRKYPQLVQACHEGPAGQTPSLVDKLLTPIPTAPPNDHSVLRYTELIDSRFTDMSSVLTHRVEVNPATNTDLHVVVRLDPNTKASFSATYLLWWEQSNEPRPAPSRRTPPPPPSINTELPKGCDKKPYLRQCGLKAGDDQD